MCTRKIIVWGREQSEKKCWFAPLWMIVVNFPLFFTVAICAIVWFCFSVQLCYVAMDGELGVRSVVYLLVFHLLLFLFLFSYWRAAVETPRPVPANFHVDTPLAEQLAELCRFNHDRSKRNQLLEDFVSRQGLPVQTRGAFLSEVRYCDICRLVKPDRAHHCSRCGHCVLRFDHHCPWLNGCVHFHNYRAYLLMQLYGIGLSICCGLLGAFELLLLILRANEAPLNWEEYTMLAFLPAAATITVPSFGILAYQQFGQALTNDTIVEATNAFIHFETGTWATFDLDSPMRNLAAVFGDRHKYLWLLPINSIYEKVEYADGITFEVRFLEDEQVDDRTTAVESEEPLEAVAAAADDDSTTSSEDKSD